MGFLILRSSLAGGSEGWQLAAGHYETAKIPLEIIAPRAGLTTANRYYKAYPGLLYEVPVVVLGGSAPFRYQLTVAPSGATIGETLPSDYLTNGPQQYGVLRWENPTTSGSPHNFTVRVTDQQGATTDVSWTLTVTTSGFIFIDSVNGGRSSANGGSATGAIGSPFLGIRDWYAGSTGGTSSATKTNSTYSGYFVYYRQGSYSTDDAYIEDTASNPRLACTGTDKPVVHLGYPGETATISLLNGSWSHYSSSAALFMGDLTFADLTATSQSATYCLNLGYDSSMADTGLYKLTFATPTNAGAGGANASCIMTGRVTPSDRHFVSHCTYNGTNSHDLWLIYDAEKYVAQWNVVSGATTGSNTWGFYSKDSWQSGSIRWNKALNASNSRPLWRFDGYSGEQAPGSAEACYNAVRTTGVGWLIGQEAASIGTDNHEYRNTIYAGNPAREIANITGTLNSTRNVIRYTTSALSNSTMTVNATENLQATSGLIDTTTLQLTGADRTTYLGIRGHEHA